MFQPLKLYTFIRHSYATGLKQSGLVHATTPQEAVKKVAKAWSDSDIETLESQITVFEVLKNNKD